MRILQSCSLYAIIKATEKLEKAYVRDIISSSECETECRKLIAHFKTLASTLEDTAPSIERFADTYKMDCPAAINHLVSSGVAATVEQHAAAAASAASVVECVQNFITAMDSLELNMVGVDQVYPLLSNKSSILPPDFEGKIKMKEWISRLAKMGAAGDLTEQQARQLHFDLESPCNSFMEALANAGMFRLAAVNKNTNDIDAHSYVFVIRYTVWVKRKEKKKQWPIEQPTLIGTQSFQFAAWKRSRKMKQHCSCQRLGLSKTGMDRRLQLSKAWAVENRDGPKAAVVKGLGC
ncbi:Vacuolar protein sorting-associated protein 28-like protein 2 [Hibiscus syriacus]|uniref:Vacuolar protein sorting-associated protein 28-like protein 2 n=1 Tax=Hibiscus syriacus TaxID=106335 RepID=A0A6A3CV24_HIBSY|nr:Vacuolar protein sorting-associated protein 28-like protein 2 [Hibiscus syriacus]